LLGGCKPFDGDTVNDAVSQRSPGPVRAAARQRVTGFPCLDEVIATAAATDPRHRFGDIDHLRAAFLSAIEADRDRDQRGWAARTMGRRSTLPRAACTR
jgi:hypothetical protein